MSLEKNNRKLFFRIVGGQFRGKKLNIPSLEITRPAKDKVREAIFNRLSFRKKAKGENLLPGSWVLDVFAGSGSMGLEAFSRGAERVYMLENNPMVINILQNNIKKLDSALSVKILNQNALSVTSAPRAMDLIFVDPPYFQDLLFPSLKALRNKGWIKKETVLLAEVDKTEEISLPKEFKIEDERTYGRVRIIEISFCPEN